MLNGRSEQEQMQIVRNVMGEMGIDEKQIFSQLGFNI